MKSARNKRTNNESKERVRRTRNEMIIGIEVKAEPKRNPDKADLL
jgi:hypothetical protein